MVAIATAAAIVASQALISGAFSLTRQAVQLGYCPRVNIVHTSSSDDGQIYIPAVNNALWIACVGLVLAFQVLEQPGRGLRHRGHRHDDHHDGTVLVVARDPLEVEPLEGGAGWRCSSWWSTWPSSATNLFKIPDGGWFPHRRGRHRLPADVHLEEGPGAAVGDRAGEHPADRPLPLRHRQAQAGRGFRASPSSSPRCAAAPRRCSCTTSSTTRCCTRM